MFSQDVMTELVNLMSNVADQPPGSGRQWQHPSDLTRRWVILYGSAKCFFIVIKNCLKWSKGRPFQCKLHGSGSLFPFRNHQRRFGSAAPKVSLKEWQAKNCTTFKRFAKVPKIFERSQLP